MALRIVVWFLLALVAGVLPCGCAGRQPGAAGHPVTRIEGTVRTHDGKVPVLAHVRVIDPATDLPSDTALVRDDGSFVLKSRRGGLAWLELTAVDHAHLRVPIVLEGGTIGVAATMGTYAPGDPTAPVQVYAWSGNPRRSEPLVAEMTREPDGDLVAELPTRARTLRVQVVNVAGGGRSVNPPRAKAYEYDDAGDYRGIVVAEAGKVRITVAKGELSQGVAPRLVLTPADSPSARVAGLGELWPTTPGPTASEEAAALWQRAKQSDDALVRRIATAMALTIDRRADAELAQDERALAKALVETTSFGDSLWVLLPDGVVRAADIGGEAAHAKLVDRVLAEQLGPKRAASVLLGRLAAATEHGDEARARALFAQISKPPYAKLGLAEMAAAWNPDRKLKPGAPLPRFEAAQLGAQARLRSEDLRGKLVLIELWATWCQPCIEGMGELHALHREFGGTPGEGRPPFEILSISMDDEAALVQKFRERWPMPWLHAFGGEDRERLFATFETATLPFTVLVDEHGKVLEATAALEPGKLRKWLEKHAAPR